MATHTVTPTPRVLIFLILNSKVFKLDLNDAWELEFLIWLGSWFHNCMTWLIWSNRKFQKLLSFSWKTWQGQILLNKIFCFLKLAKRIKFQFYSCGIHGKWICFYLTGRSTNNIFLSCIRKDFSHAGRELQQVEVKTTWNDLSPPRKNRPHWRRNGTRNAFWVSCPPFCLNPFP